MVHVVDINLRIDLSLAWGIKENKGKGKWIAVFLGDFV